MRIAILDANYSQPEYQGLSGAWLRWELDRAGILPVDASEAEYVLVTVSCAQNWRDVRRVLKRSRVSPSARIILGGAGAYTPAVFDSLASVVCVGEGARWIRTFLRDGYEAACALPESWIPGDMREVIPNTEFPWDVPPITAPDGIVRVFSSRGCKYRCLFCQTGWESCYRVNPDPERLRSQIHRLQRANKRFTIMTNEGAEETVRDFYGHEFVSMRLQNLKKLMPISRRFAKNVHIGVEGVSERLRTAVGKPVDNDELLRTSHDLLANKIAVRWFFVIGLPGETAQDYEELRYLVKGAARFPWHFVFMHFHPFIPKPATPLGVLPLQDEYAPLIEEFRSWYYTGLHFTKRIHLTTIMGYKTRLDHAMADMGASESELRRGWWEQDNPNWRVRYLGRPATLRQVAGRYAARVGLNQPRPATWAIGNAN